MSNSGNEQFGLPILPGYEVEWDEAGQEFVATNSERGTVLRGKDQAELNAARGQLVNRLADDIMQMIREAPGRGYSPPPS